MPVPQNILLGAAVITLTVQRQMKRRRKEQHYSEQMKSSRLTLVENRGKKRRLLPPGDAWSDSVNGASRANPEGEEESAMNYFECPKPNKFDLSFKYHPNQKIKTLHFNEKMALNIHSLHTEKTHGLCLAFTTQENLFTIVLNDRRHSSQEWDTWQKCTTCADAAGEMKCLNLFWACCFTQQIWKKKNKFMHWQ